MLCPILYLSRLKGEITCAYRTTQQEIDVPYIHIQVTREGVTTEQKKRLIAGATDLMADVLGKEPATTFVVIEEVDTDNWGVAGKSVTELRLRPARASR
jgi:4-oxalocrotonate tautomerase